MKLSKLFLVGAALVAFSATGFADETKIYPGTFCVGDGMGSSSQLSFNWGVRAENKAATKKVVNCPIIRNADSTGPYTATIYIYDSSREESVQCKFQSWTANGQNKIDTPFPLSGSGFVGFRKLTRMNLSTQPGWSYNFLCKLPRDSYISSYKVSED